MDINIDEDFLTKFIQENILNEEKIDNCLEEKIPLDIIKIIYDYVKPYCEECGKCCNVCKFYCFLDCLRYNNRNVCCRGELNQEIRKYSLVNIESDSEEHEEHDEAPLLNNQ